jgi:hypothetical protein
MPALMVGLIGVAAVNAPLVFKVRTIPIALMAQESDLIIEASVTEVVAGADGTRVAKCKPTANWKGQASDVVEFLASPTWTCDISTAEAGERVLLFLKVGESGQLYIYHSGRGRMPLREFEEHSYATFFGDITFPEKTVKVFDEHVRSLYNQGVELGELKRLVAEAIEAARRAAEPEGK